MDTLPVPTLQPEPAKSTTPIAIGVGIGLLALAFGGVALAVRRRSQLPDLIDVDDLEGFDYAPPGIYLGLENGARIGLTFRALDAANHGAREMAKHYGIQRRPFPGAPLLPHDSDE